MDDYGITLSCPTEALSAGPIPVEVVMRADPRTYWDNDGILDKALTVAVVRRDRPGLRFLPKIDPHAIMLPDPPLPGRPSDEQLAAERWMVSEAKSLDAVQADGRQRGAADYFVSAGFSAWWAAPCELTVTDPDGRRATAVSPSCGADGGPYRVEAVGAGPRLERRAQGTVLVLPIQADLSRHAFPPGEENGNAWLTVLGFHLGPRGGACGAILEIEVERKSTAISGEVAIPLTGLVPSPGAGRWLFQGFIGYEILPVAELMVRDDDVR